MAGDDAGLLVVAGRVTGELQDLSGQILEHSGQIHRSSGSHTVRIVPLAEQPVDAAHRELEPGPGGAGLRLGSGFTAGLSSSRHVRASVDSLSDRM